MLSAVTGVWTSAALKPREDWPAGLPSGVSGRLTGDPAADRAALDAWAAEGARGLVPSWTPDSLLRTTTFAFTVRADHDLPARPELFGLAAATDRRTGHFPRHQRRPAGRRPGRPDDDRVLQRRRIRRRRGDRGVEKRAREPAREHLRKRQRPPRPRESAAGRP